MKKVVTIAYNAVVAKLMENDHDLKIKVQAILSYKVAGAEQTFAFKSRGWDGRSSFLKFSNGTFPAGFVSLVSAHLNKMGYQVRRLTKPLPLPLGPENPRVDKYKEDPRYDYQMKTVNLLVKHGQIIARIATGGGKSRIAKLAYARIKRRTMFLTTRSVLMHQMKEDFESMGVKVGVMGDGVWKPVKGVNVAMVQSIMAKMKKQPKTVAKILESFEFVILEEAHESSGNGFYDIMQLCKNAYYRLALTATPFMKDDEEANMRLYGVSGPIGLAVDEKMLIDRGILAKPYFKFVKLRGTPRKLFRSTPWPAAYRIGIVENSFRNDKIVHEALRASLMNMSVLILIQHKAHGRILKEALDKLKVTNKFIFGESKQEERNQALAELSSGEINVLIGSTILDVGVNVPSIDMIIIGGAGKAEVGMRQRIGRGLREKKNGPNVAYIIDFQDDLNTHLKKHYKQRFNIVKSTEGFGENIVEDFDLKGFHDKSSNN